jgi:hypothetical protein
MVKLVVGDIGTGKTKRVIDEANTAAKTSKGLVVCIERGTKLRFDVCNAVRLIDSSEFDIKGFQVMRGFITGLYAGNFDITDVFVYSLHKVADITDIPELEKFMAWLQTFGTQHDVNFTVSVRLSQNALTDSLKSLL